VLLLGGLPACVYRTPEAHIPASLPPLDQADLHVVVETTRLDGVAVAPHEASAVQQEVESLLAEALRSRGTTGGQAGGVVVRVTLGPYWSYRDCLAQDGMCALGLVGVPLGLVIESQQVRVDVSVATNERTLRGHGSADRDGSIYSAARKRALAVALDQALAAAL
jgi:hypothetical protein